MLGRPITETIKLNLVEKFIEENPYPKMFIEAFINMAYCRKTRMAIKMECALFLNKLGNFILTFLNIQLSSR